MTANHERAFLYSVDIIPTYEVNGERYVAKPVVGDAMPDDLTWRRSFTIEDRDKITGADSGCRKVLRILKVINYYFLGMAVNLLSSMSQTTIVNLRDIIQRLRTNGILNEKNSFG